MSKYYELNYFKPYELVPPETHEKYGDKAIRYIDPRLIANLNAIRDYLGVPMVINDYEWGGKRKSSGLRLPGDSYHSVYSAHSFGMAFDAVGNFDYDQLREDIISKKEIIVPHPCRLEMDINWFHIDVMNETDRHVITFSP
mgnify:FL=1